MRIAVGARMPTEPLISVAAPLGKPVGVNSLEAVSGGDAARHTDAQARRQTDSQTVRQSDGGDLPGGAVCRAGSVSVLLD